MKRFFLILTIILSSSFVAAAQTMDVELTVVDDSGKPVAEVMVEFDELEAPVYTGKDGVAKFTIDQSGYVTLSINNALYKIVVE